MSDIPSKKRNRNKVECSSVVEVTMNTNEVVIETTTVQKGRRQQRSRTDEPVQSEVDTSGAKRASRRKVVATEEVVATEVAVKSESSRSTTKRGKKSAEPIIVNVHDVVSDVIDNESSKSVVKDTAAYTEDDNVIIHLPVNMDTVSNFVNDRSAIPVMEADNDSNWFSNIEPGTHEKEDLNNRFENLVESRKTDFDISKTKSSSVRRPVDYTMAQFSECNKKKTWPQRTNIYCFNCCHSFDHTPSALPFKYQNGIFYVYGCFCYPECAAAFNFTDVLSVENANENYNLLNIMYKIVYSDPFYRVKIPGHRTCLNIFGGKLDINEYRASFENPYISHNIIMPPVLSILPIQEENNIIYYKKNFQTQIINNKGYDGANRREKEIILKRSKPLVKKQNTLETCMNIVSSA